jgi:CheY-like chemotaxis protein
MKKIRLNSVIKTGTPAVLYGDPYRIKQILINLIGNAVKFTDRGSVDFSAEGIIGNNGNVNLILEVTDTGIGIEEDKQKIIFEDFVQAETSTTRKYGGTGLGLSIVKKLVDLHGGTISCESRKNQGTRITCQLVVREGIESRIEQDETPPLPVPGEFNNLRILIVDDEEYNRLLLKKILERWNIKCDDAFSGMEAIQILKERRYDILFMDIRMPDIDGIKTARFIRNDLKISEKDMQVIMISAGQDLKIKENGINAYIRKPFTEELLLFTILSVRKNLPQAISEERENEEKVKPDENQKINLNNLYHISGGDNDFVKQMLTTFISSTSSGLSEMQLAVSSGNRESVANLAHKMLAPCRHIGAMELYSLLRKIEENISKGNSAGIVEKMTSRAMNEFEIVSNLLNEHISILK